ncbi:MAG: dockerin type I repeat-containing protein, partial [Ruminococcus sp.]|nr:dockerin type I repeat-containing protein [Ruminococcus sp.]
DSYFLKSKYTECVMDIDGGKTDEGTNVQMYTKNDTAAQAFQILKIENYTIKIPGDLNQDGTLSLTDLIPLQQSLLRQTTLTADQAQLADYNGDGSINVLDLMLLKRALLAL